MTSPSTIPVPKGTRVRLRQAHGGVEAGALLRVEAIDGDTYRLSVGHRHIEVPRDAFLIADDRQARRLHDAHRAWQVLRHHVVLEVVVGSVAWGLATDGSDLDRRGVFVLPRPWPDKLGPPPATLRPAGEEATYEEAHRFVDQAVAGDLNAFDVLASPRVLRCQTAGTRLRDALDDLLSRRLLHTQLRYAQHALERLDAQHERAQAEAVLHARLVEQPAEQDDLVDPLRASGLAADPDQAARLLRRVLRSLKDRGLVAHQTAAGLRDWALSTPAPRPPVAPSGSEHLIRVLIVADALACSGQLHLDLSEHPDRSHLLAIKDGDVPWRQIAAEASRRAERVRSRIEACPLPEAPDPAKVDALRRALSSLPPEPAP